MLEYLCYLNVFNCTVIMSWGILFQCMLTISNIVIIITNILYSISIKMSYYKPLYTDNIKHVRGYKSTVMCVCDGVYDVCVCVNEARFANYWKPPSDVSRLDFCRNNTVNFSVQRFRLITVYVKIYLTHLQSMTGYRNKI